MKLDKFGLFLVLQVLAIFTETSSSINDTAINNSEKNGTANGTDQCCGCCGSSQSGEWQYNHGSGSAPDGSWSYNWGTGSGPNGSSFGYASGSGHNTYGSSGFGFGWGSSEGGRNENGEGHGAVAGFGFGGGGAAEDASANATIT